MRTARAIETRLARLEQRMATEPDRRLEAMSMEELDAHVLRCLQALMAMTGSVETAVKGLS